MSGRGRKKKEEEEGEQIKSCQMEILGFNRSETGVRVCLFSSRLYVMQIEINIYASPTICSPFAFYSTSFLIGGGKRQRRRPFPRRPSTTPGKNSTQDSPADPILPLHKIKDLKRAIRD